ncbi:hypothetical protein [Flavobacterium sp.]|nr:hypothetical protein [Flavobacterium sp.]
MSLNGFMLLTALAIGFLFSVFYGRRAKRDVEKFERKKNQNKKQE